MKNLETTKIFLAGHKGMVGNSVLRKLRSFKINPVIREKTELDLRSQEAVYSFTETEKPNLIILCAARVGGIRANNEFKSEFLLENLEIQQNVIGAAHKFGVPNLIFLGSSCIYPRAASIPINENALLTGPLELTNEAYAIAKIAGLKACQYLREQHGRNYISIMPTNLYGPGDNFDPLNSHVLPALMKRIHDAKESSQETVRVWGTGQPLREFMHVDDLADAILFFANLSNNLVGDTLNRHKLSHINVGSGDEISIANLAKLIKKTIGYEGRIVFDPSKPDGTFRKLMDSSICNQLGWQRSIQMSDGLKNTYIWMKNNLTSLRNVGV